MNFVSATFIIFFAIVLALWRLLPHSTAKRVVGVANLVFYGYWYPPFIALLLASAIIDYGCSLQIRRSRVPKRWLLLSVFSNLGILFVFKYSNFFLGTTSRLVEALGADGFSLGLQVILPIGISFYTFQSMSYTIDVYRGQLEPCRRFSDFFLYLSFFPQLVAGPIVRASAFLPQLRERSPLTIADLHFALYKISRGLFLKVVIADNIAPHVNQLFAASPGDLSRPEAWAGAAFFGVQIFCDFAGYSDIAIGCSRIFGFRISENFRNPYLSRSIREFWGRWHISLSTWFRDYLYFALGGNRGSAARASLKIVIVFLVSGLWHGAGWTFIIWGGLHGIGSVASRATDRLPTSRAWNSLLVFVTYILVTLAWPAFRCQTIGDTLGYWATMLLPGATNGALSTSVLNGLAWLAVFAGFQLISALREFRRWPDSGPLAQLESWAYFAALMLAPGVATDFIYFQF